MHNLCNADIRLTYLKKSYSVTMGTFQMACLLGFNQASTLTIRELQEFSQLPEKELVKQVQSLLEAKLLLLVTSGGEKPNAIVNNNNETMKPKNENNEDSSGATTVGTVKSGEELTDSTQITLNMDYSNKRTKFKINAAVQKETPQETEMTQSSVDEDRKLYLQATIVRIMKSRKILNHNLLIQEVRFVFFLFFLYNQKSYVLNFIRVLNYFLLGYQSIEATI